MLNEFLSNPLFAVIMAVLTAFIVTTITIPSIIHISKEKHLFDEPDERKVHKAKIPNLGGIAIFGGFIISLAIWANIGEARIIQYIMAASCLIFLVGAKDDIIELSPKKKFIGQMIATAIIVFLGGLYFHSFHDLFPAFNVPAWLGIPITIFTILVITNAFNLIDGINALSGTQGAIISIAFGIWFWLAGDYQMVVLISALVGAIIAFLRFNVSPAKIFMGDTGSLLIGLLCAVMAIRFTELNAGEMTSYKVNAAPAVAIGFLTFPLFDLLRAFATRIMKGKSPFHPDRNHLHHILLDCGLSHMQATTALGVKQVIYIALVFWLQHFKLNSWVIIAILLVISLIISTILDKLRKRKTPTNI